MAKLIWIVFFALTVFGNSRIAILHAQLQPAEVAVIAAADNNESLQLAKHYLEQRKIPEKNLCLINVSDENKLAIDDWRTKVRPQIKSWLDTNDPDHKLRCLVTIRGVPLSISESDPNAPDAYLDFLNAERSVRTRKIAETLNDMRKLGLAEGTESEIPEITYSDDKGLVEWRLDFESVASAVQKRVQGLTGTDRDIASKKFESLVALMAGTNLLINSLQQQLTNNSQADERMKADFQFLRGRASMLQECITLILQLPPSDETDTLTFALGERLGGMLGSVSLIDEQIDVIGRNLTGAAFDSELALIRWQSDYRLHRWQPNFLRTSYRELVFTKAYPTMMVARIDGPSWEVCRNMIDQAIATEQAGGLVGKAYLDLRGLDLAKSSQLDAEFERDLSGTAEMLRKDQKLQVVVDANAAVMGEGVAPDAALYCGAYSLGKYVDAFTWKPGSIGYHLSTIEASGLHDETSQSWCRSMLNDGACATIGAVEESGLGALPRPQELFKRMVVDHQTLGDAYWASLPFTSWQVILLGDPLYRPFTK